MSAHTQTTYTDDQGNTGPDYCAECSHAAQEWVAWPCPPVLALQQAADAGQQAVAPTAVLEPPAPPEPEPQPCAVDAGEDEELAQLHALYPELKAAADDAAKKLDAVKQAIKLKLSERDPEARKFTLTGEHGPSLALTYSVSNRFDSKRFRRDQPDVFEAYQTQSGSWSLREA